MSKALQGKLLGLLREYKLREVPDGFSRQFFTRSRRPPLLGMGLTWWLTPRGLQILNEMARMTVAALPDLNLDVDATAKLVEGVLQDHGDDGRAFNAFAYTRAATLFDARSVPETQLGETIWGWIEETARAAVTEWLVVLPLPRIQSASVDIGFDGISLLRASDIDRWQKIAAEFDRARLWDPKTGHDDRKYALWRHGRPETWGLCRLTGTADVAKSIARERFRTLIALLFAEEFPAKPILSSKSGTEPETLTTQFASLAGDVEYTQLTSHIGVLQPPILTDITVTDELLGKIRAWYRGRQTATSETERRATVGSHFVHYSFVASGLDSFIHSFVALDAFFGVRGRVEASIVDAIEKLFPAEPLWRDRTARLFDLRSEVLHGGSSTIKGWPDYEDYRRHFKTEPQRDVVFLATTALRRFFD